MRRMKIKRDTLRVLGSQSLATAQGGMLSFHCVSVVVCVTDLCKPNDTDGCNSTQYPCQSWDICW